MKIGESFKKLLLKKAKEGKFIPDDKLEAKQKVHGELSDLMKEIMGDGVKKVTVIAKDKKGLEKGLDTAKDVLDKKINPVEDIEEMTDEADMEAAEDAEEMIEESEKMADMEEVELSKEEKIAKLKAELAALEA